MINIIHRSYLLQLCVRSPPNALLRDRKVGKRNSLPPANQQLHPLPLFYSKNKNFFFSSPIFLWDRKMELEQTNDIIRYLKVNKNILRFFLYYMIMSIYIRNLISFTLIYYLLLLTLFLIFLKLACAIFNNIAII